MFSFISLYFSSRDLLFLYFFKPFFFCSFIHTSRFLYYFHLYFRVVFSCLPYKFPFISFNLSFFFLLSLLSLFWKKGKYVENKRRLMRAPCPFCVPPPNIFFFYAVRVISKESRQLVFPRTCCFFLSWLQSVFILALFVSFLPYTLISPSALRFSCPFQFVSLLLLQFSVLLI
jgi:hypothetical protein